MVFKPAVVSGGKEEESTGLKEERGGDRNRRQTKDKGLSGFFSCRVGRFKSRLLVETVFYLFERGQEEDLSNLRRVAALMTETEKKKEKFSFGPLTKFSMFPFVFFG